MDTQATQQGARAEAPDWWREARPAVTALYQTHATGLVRLAVVMLGDRPAAEDVVQEAFCGLYRRWGRLSEPGKALPYLRSSVLNGCRSVLRRSRRPGRDGPAPGWETAESAEAMALLGEEHRILLAALRRLPDRQRETLVLRYYLDLSPDEIARAMGVSQGTVKSTTSRALTALERLMREI